LRFNAANLLLDPYARAISGAVRFGPEVVAGQSRAALHAKLVAADQCVAVLGSANLTDKALAYNLELDV
jgi:phosphatidylserine/phosphatidylglycerophosphate/cardiolipin synthase-like enzyme